MPVVPVAKTEILADNADPQAAHRKLVKKAYLYHTILAVCMAAVLAMTVHLWTIKAAPDVVGGGMFLLFVWVGLPIVFCTSAALVYCQKTRYDWRLTLLTALLIAPITEWLFIGGQALIILSIVLELLYIGLTAFFGFTWARQEPN